MGLETPNQQPQAGGLAIPSTPSFSGAQVPGGAAPDANQKAQQILAQLLQAASRKQMANTAQPAAVPGMTDPNQARNIGMNTAWPHAWGTQRFLAGLAGNIKNAVAQQKQKQLTQAEGDWNTLQAYMNEKFAAEQSGNPQAVQAAEQKIQSVLGDPKKLKNMAKALNQDWLNPEKTSVYGEALKRTTAKSMQTDQQNQQKQTAAQGLKSAMQRLIQKAFPKQPQLIPDEQKRMGQEIEAKAPVTTATSDPKLLIEQEKAEADLIRAQKASPEKYEFKTKKQADGSEIIVAVDRTNPTNPAIEVKSASGETIQPGQKRFVDDGKLEIVGGIPTGRVKHQGAWVAPGQSGYTKQDADAVNLGMNAQGLSEKQKEKLQAIRGESFARARANYQFSNVVNKQTGEVGEVSAFEMAKNPGLYSGASEQEKVSARDAVHESLNANFKALDESLDKLPNGLDTETQATIALAIRSDNPGVLDTLVVNKIKQGTPDEVLQLITNIKAMQEDVMTLRAVGGMGQGSDTMRHAMVAIIPGPGTSSVKEAKMQIKAARRTSEALFSGRPQSKLPTDDKPRGGGGDVIVITPEDMAGTGKKP